MLLHYFLKKNGRKIFKSKKNSLALLGFVVLLVGMSTRYYLFHFSKN